MSSRRSAAGYAIDRLSGLERERHAARLTPDQRRILLAQGTEAPFCGNLLDNHQAGAYACALCGLPLFSSAHKFVSGTGWPSFWQAVDPDHVRELVDDSHGMRRVEVRCGRCDGHLGHVFPDGPPPTWRRYCVNSAALEFFGAGTQPVQREAGA